MPFVSLALGLSPALRRSWRSRRCWRRADVFAPLRYLGENSIVIYLAFFLGMAASRSVLLKTGLITDIGTVALLVTPAGVVGALALFWAVRAHAAAVPVRAARRSGSRLRDKPKYALQPAE